MSREFYRRVALIAILQFVMSGCQRNESMLTQEWRANEWKGEPVFLTPAELERIGGVVHLALKSPQSELLAKRFREFGFSWRAFPKEDFFVLKEEKKHLRGLGYFLIRAGETQPVLIQAPHGFHDTKTGEIALLLFEESNVRAVSLNTAHRKRLDLAKEEETLFAAFLEEFSRIALPAVVLQLHGFEQAKRRTPKGQSAEMIVSGGALSAGPELLRLKTILNEYFGSGVMLYPEDVQELGGTKNSQAIAVRDNEGTRFIHLELSRSIRERLSSSREARALLLMAVMEVLE